MSTQEAKVQFSEVVVEKLQVLETENTKITNEKGDVVDNSGSEEHKDELLRIETEKLEIVEDPAECIDTRDNLLVEDTVNTVGSDNAVEMMSGDEAVETLGDANVATHNTESASISTTITDEPFVVSKETLVKNLETTQMVTSETQTYETVAQVTEYTENIVAETVIDDEHTDDIEYTPEAPDIVTDEINTQANDSSDELHEQDMACNTTSMEMDCQTEMDPELLAIIEAAEKIEAEQHYEDGFEEEDYASEDNSQEDSEDEEIQHRQTEDTDATPTESNDENITEIHS